MQTIGNVDIGAQNPVSNAKHFPINASPWEEHQQKAPFFVDEFGEVHFNRANRSPQPVISKFSNDQSEDQIRNSSKPSKISNPSKVSNLSSEKSGAVSRVTPVSSAMTGLRGSGDVSANIGSTAKQNIDRMKTNEAFEPNAAVQQEIIHEFNKMSPPRNRVNEEFNKMSDEELRTYLSGGGRKPPNTNNKGGMAASSFETPVRVDLPFEENSNNNNNNNSTSANKAPPHNHALHAISLLKNAQHAIRFVKEKHGSGGKRDILDSNKSQVISDKTAIPHVGRGDTQYLD